MDMDLHGDVSPNPVLTKQPPQCMQAVIELENYGEHRPG